MTDMIIDTPSPFAPVEEWQTYLMELKSLKPQSLDIKVLIREAEQTIRDRQQAARSEQ